MVEVETGDPRAKVQLETRRPVADLSSRVELKEEPRN